MPSEIEEIKARLDIVDVVGQYLPLQKAGRTFKAPCPFHDERTPSFIVSPDRQTWHCFGACGTGGDVLNFVMRKEGLEFVDALKMLAERTGVKLRERQVSEKEDKQRRRMFDANEAAAKWYRQLLLTSDAAKGAREYVERRGIDAKTAEAFLLGYSLPTWEGAREHLTQEGFSEAELVKAGLLIEGEQGLHDRFRGRLMFPIRDAKGNAIGFGARALDDSMPKYLNTSQTPVFDKSGVLYAMDRSQAGIRREGTAVVVEGYMDVIAAHQHGFDNVVASMGTALTERQVRLLKRLTNNVVLALDADTAGNEAAIRGHDVVRGSLEQSEPASPVVSWRGLITYQQTVSVELRVAILPVGRDPDDVIRADAEAWRTLIDTAAPVLDYRLDAAAASQDLASASGRSQLVKAFLPLLSAVTDPVVRAHYLQKVSRLSGTHERDLLTMLAEARKPQPATRPGNAQSGPASRTDSREKFLLALLLRYPDLRDAGLTIAEDLFSETENRELLATWKSLPPESLTPDALQIADGALSDVLSERLERLFLLRMPAFDAKEAREALLDCRLRLERRQMEIEKQAIGALLAEREDELGSVIAVNAASADTDNEQVKEVLSLHIRDMESGLKLHARDKVDGGTAVETRTNG